MIQTKYQDALLPFMIFHELFQGGCKYVVRSSFDDFGSPSSGLHRFCSLPIYSLVSRVFQMNLPSSSAIYLGFVINPLQTVGC